MKIVRVSTEDSSEGSRPLRLKEDADDLSFVDLGDDEELSHDFCNRKETNEIDRNRTNVTQPEEDKPTKSELVAQIAELQRLLLEKDSQLLEGQHNQELAHRDLQLVRRNLEITKRDLELARKDLELAKRDHELEICKLTHAAELARLERQPEKERETVYAQSSVVSGLEAQMAELREKLESFIKQDEEKLAETESRLESTVLKQTSILDDKIKDLKAEYSWDRAEVESRLKSVTNEPYSPDLPGDKAEGLTVDSSTTLKELESKLVDALDNLADTLNQKLDAAKAENDKAQTEIDWRLLSATVANQALDVRLFELENSKSGLTGDIENQSDVFEDSVEALKASTASELTRLESWMVQALVDQSAVISGGMDDAAKEITALNAKVDELREAAAKDVVEVESRLAVISQQTSLLFSECSGHGMFRPQNGHLV